MIIDTHAHLGVDQAFDSTFTEAELLEAQQECGIDLTIVQPATAHDLATVQRYHDGVADLAARHPGRFVGMANPNPHLPGDQYAVELRRCVEELGFVAVKIHPLGHAVNPLGRDGRRAFAAIAEMGLPAMVHTGTGTPWSAPALLETIAMAHPQLRIVLAHAGGMVYAGEAGQVATRHANVYLEPSWCGGFIIKPWVAELGAERIMLGSDHADNAATELTKYRTMGLHAEQLAWILGGTAAAVFGLPRGGGQS